MALTAQKMGLKRVVCSASPNQNVTDKTLPFSLNRPNHNPEDMNDLRCSECHGTARDTPSIEMGKCPIEVKRENFCRASANSSEDNNTWRLDEEFRWRQVTARGYELTLGHPQLLLSEQIQLRFLRSKPSAAVGGITHNRAIANLYLRPHCSTELPGAYGVTV